VERGLNNRRYKMRIKVNFTQSDIEELQMFLDDEMQEPVFQWTIDGVLVDITVGDDED